MSSKLIFEQPTGMIERSASCLICGQPVKFYVTLGTHIMLKFIACPTCVFKRKINKHLKLPAQYIDRLMFEHPHGVSRRHGHNV